MIKKVIIQNAYGIKSFNVDFMLKHVQEEPIIENQIINIENEKIALSPLFLAKNGAGKTSFIRILDYVFRFLRKESFIQELIHLKWYSIQYKLQVSRRGADNPFYPLGGAEDFSLHDAINNTIQKLFKEISFAGSNRLIVNLQLINNQNVTMHLDENNFIFIINKQRIDIKNILDTLKIPNYHLLAPNQIAKSIQEQLDKLVKNIAIFEKNIHMFSMFRDVHPITKISDIYVKKFTSRHIDFIAKEIGTNFIEVLLKKIDPNIKSIKFNPTSKDFEIHLKSVTNNWAISPSALSFGTQKFLEILAKSVILFKTGGVMLIDEIENGLHLSLIKLLVTLYSDPTINRKAAQIILTTHNPLIAEQKIIDPWNIFMEEENNFVNIKNLQAKKRSTDVLAFVKSKNYYNDIFWSSKKDHDKISLSSLAISQIVNVFSESASWQKN